MCDPENLTEKQSTALTKLKESLSDVLQSRHDDHELLRWLTARDFNVTKSEQMFRTSLEWRRENGIDKILETYNPPEVCMKYAIGDRTSFVGQDKQGALVQIICPGRVDLKGLFKSLKRDEFCRYCAYMLESAIRRGKELGQTQGRRIDQTVRIGDLEGFGLKNLWKPGVNMATEMMAMMEANYPERLKRILIINAPTMFPIFFAIVSKFMSRRTKAKIKVLGRNYQSELLKYIDADQLPVHYGGTKTGLDGDPMCSDLVCYAGKVPAEYYISMDEGELEKFTEISISRRSSKVVECAVNVEGSIVRWQFLSVGYDIGFGVFLKTAEKQKVSEMTVVMATERVNSHIVYEDGTLTCDKAGTYVLVFDNSYSWTRSKKVKYSVEVLEPSTELTTLDQQSEVPSIVVQQSEQEDTTEHEHGQGLEDGQRSEQAIQVSAISVQQGDQQSANPTPAVQQSEALGQQKQESDVSTAFQPSSESREQVGEQPGEQRITVSPIAAQQSETPSEQQSEVNAHEMTSEQLKPSEEKDKPTQQEKDNQIQVSPIVEQQSEVNGQQIEVTPIDKPKHREKKPKDGKDHSSSSSSSSSSNSSSNDLSTHDQQTEQPTQVLVQDTESDDEPEQQRKYNQELSELGIEGPIERDEVPKDPMATGRYCTELARASGEVPEDISAFRLDSHSGEK